MKKLNHNSDDILKIDRWRAEIMLDAFNKGNYKELELHLFLLTKQPKTC